MLETGLAFLEALPPGMKRPAGPLEYGQLCLQLKPKGHPLKTRMKVLLLLGLLYFLYRRFLKK